MKIITNAKLDRIKNKIERGKKKAKVIVATQVRKDSNYYAPMRDGFLIDSSSTHSDIENGVVTWSTPYARRLYYNPQFNFRKDPNPNAQGLWFEAAKSRHLEDWIRLGGEAYLK